MPATTGEVIPLTREFVTTVDVTGATSWLVTTPTAEDATALLVELTTVLVVEVSEEIGFPSSPRSLTERFSYTRIPLVSRSRATCSGVRYAETEWTISNSSSSFALTWAALLLTVFNG